MVAPNPLAFIPSPGARPDRQPDDLRTRLLAAFDLSDRRGTELLVAYAEIHAKRYPKVPE